MNEIHIGTDFCNEYCAVISNATSSCADVFASVNPASIKYFFKKLISNIMLKFAKEKL